MNWYGVMPAVTTPFDAGLTISRARWLDVKMSWCSQDVSPRVSLNKKRYSVRSTSFRAAQHAVDGAIHPLRG